MTATTYDAVVIGAGHNGLVAAAILARAGRRVLLAEARDAIGGAAGEYDLAPGYRAPACAHLLHGLDAGLVESLELARHGLDLGRDPLSTIGLAPGEQPMELTGGHARRLGADGAHTPVDARGHSRLLDTLERSAGPLARWLGRAPPRLATRAPADLLALARLGLDLRGLGARPLRELLRIATMNAADLLDEHVTDPHLAGLLAFDAVAGTRLGPRSPGTVLTWLHRLALAHRQGPGAGHGARVPVGGIGRLVDALARSARSAGAQLRTDAPVARILTRADAVEGVELAGGERLATRCVVSTLHPARTLIDLVGAQHLEIALVRALGSLRSRGAAAKLDLALDALPEAPVLDPARLGARIVVSPGIASLERAFDHVKYGEHAAHPALEVVLPSVLDPGLAPPGGHVLSALVLYAADRPSGDPGEARDALREATIERLESVMPGLRVRIVEARLRTPADLEGEIGLGAGHWHHVELGFDQLFWSRPLPALARHATPIAGLFLGGAGAHPGGGLSGLPGAGAARAALAARGRA